MEYQPDKRIAEAFDNLEKKIEGLLGIIHQLREENKRLKQQLTELQKLRAEALHQLNNIIDKIETLL